MFKKNHINDQSLEDAIAEVFADLKGMTSETDDYAHSVDQLDKLYKLKEYNRSSQVSPDTLAMIVGNLAGIVLIVGHERAHVVTSKALGFVGKFR